MFQILRFARDDSEAVVFQILRFARDDSEAVVFQILRFAQDDNDRESEAQDDRELRMTGAFRQADRRRTVAFLLQAWRSSTAPLS